MYKTIHYYGYRRLIIELKVFVKQVLFIQKSPVRNTAFINELYENLREEKHKKLNDLKNVNDYLFDIPFLYPHGELRRSMINNKIVYGKANNVALKILQLIENIMNNNSYKNVIELGSGGGKNLLWFASKYKNINFIGLELSPKSVELATAAAKKYNINNVKFYVCDLTKVETYKKNLTKDTFVYSHHTLEEMPRIYKIPLIALKNSSVNVIALLEPVYMFKFSRFFLDLSKLIRIYNKDRLYGLKKFSKKNLKKTFNIEIEDLGFAVKPENPTTLVLLQRINKII